ncbi:lambda family phage tail tape measure protein [Pseudomonas sp. JUb42]|uniref:phage tail tape measure protein n=1 Tax=Pseudomonas sp. JUb42 TaxID=2940611 RepID=UPI0021681AD8|nr:phage tail tape measure protein [Pseudomonas sp. JUb42]MCS3467081.1 lambda family phage tail tape measure protein [Pseudomonas sp. JUb42]
MALTSRLSLEVDGKSAEQQVLAVRKALDSLTEAGLRAGPVLTGVFGSITNAAKGINAAANSIDTARKSLDGLNETGKKTGTIIGGAAGSVTALGGSAASAEAKLAAARKELEALNLAAAKSAAAMAGAGGAMNGLGQGARNATGQVQSLERQVKSLAAQAAGLAGPLAAAFSVKSFYDAAEAYSTLTNRMKLVTTGAQELAQAQSAVFAIAQSAHQPLTATAELYQRIATNQKELKLTGEGVAGVVGTISKTLAISGASAASANAALVQLGQAFASGTLRGEELNSVMEQAPALAQAIAAGMGKTVGELRSLGAAGLLTADAVVKALQAQQGAVDALFSKTSVTIGNSLTTLENSFTQFVGRMDQASGASAAISSKIVAVAQAMDGLTGSSTEIAQSLQAVGAVMTGVAAGGAVMLTAKIGQLTLAMGQSVYSYYATRAAAIASASAELEDAKAKAIQAQSAVIAAERNATAALLQTRMTEALVVARMEERAANEAVALSQARLATASTGILGIMGGAGGLALIVGAAAATYMLLRDNTDEATKALDQQGLSIEEIVKKYDALNASQQRVKRLDWLDERAKNLDTATQALKQYADAEKVIGLDDGVAAQFRQLIDEVKRGSRDLDSVTQWLKDNANISPGVEKSLGAIAAEYTKVTQRNSDLDSVLKLVDQSQKGVTKSTDELREAQNKGQTQTRAQIGDWEKYIAKLRESRDLYGANKEAQAAYEASKMGLNEKQREEARIVSSQIDILDQYKTAIKKGDVARQESLKNELVALYTQQQAMEDAAAAEKKSQDEALKKSKETADAKITEMYRVLAEANKVWNAAANLSSGQSFLTGQNMLLVPSKQQSIAGRSMVSTNAPTPSTGVVPRKSAVQLANEQIAQLNETVDETSKRVKAYTEDAGTKALDQAKQQYAVLVQQGVAIEQQGSGTKALGPAAKELIEWEQQLADIKNKQTLTADQKSLLAKADQITAQKKLNAEQERTNDLKKIELDNTAKLIALQDQLQDQLKLAQDGLDSQVAGLGMGQKGREQIQEDLRIRQDYQKQLEKLQRDYNKIVNPTTADKGLYDQETGKIKDALAERLKMQKDYYAGLDQAQSDWANGANAALQDYLDEASNVSGQTYTLFSNSLHGLEDVFVTLATTGKLSFKSLADSIIADLARIAARTLIVQPLLSALFSGGGGGGVAALGGLAAIFGSSGSSGSSGSGGTSIGSLANSASSAYSLVTGVGPAASAGYTSGGVVGAVKGVASYYGNITSSAVSTIAGSASQIAAALTGQTAAYGATQGAYTGSAYASWVASQGASQGAASAGGSAAGGAALWPLAIIMGMYQSGKLYDAGLRYDKGEIEGSDLSKLGDKLGTAGLDRKLAFESIGLADKVASKLFGGKIGAMLSGSTFAMSVENMISSKLFGTGYQTKDSGLSLQVNNGDLDAQSYIDQKKKGGLLSGKSKKRTLYSALDTDQEDQLQGLYAATQLGVIDLVKQIGVTVEDGAFDAMKVAELKISTQGKTEDEIQAAVSGWFNYASDVMVATLDKGVGGFGYSFTELARRINVFTGFNAQLDVIDVKMYKLSAESMELANALVEAAGGTEAMTANINTYYDKFFSDTEKTSDALAAVQKQFSDMDVSLPGTREAYRDMVSAIDLTTDAGQQLFLKLTAAAGAAASAYDILEARQATYYTGFYSEAENTARSVAAITAEFKKANVTLPDTRAGYRKMVEGIDQTTESGKKLYETLMALSADADTFYKAQEQTAAAAQATAMTAVSTAMSALQRAVDAQKTALTNAYNDQVSVLNDSASSLSTSISGLTSIGNSLDAALKSLNGTSDTAVRMLRSQAEATLQSALATARSGGSLSGFTGLSDALSTVSDNSDDLYSSLEDFNRDQGRTANVIAELNAINGVQLTTEQKALEAVQDQLKVLKLTYDAQIKELDDSLAQAQAQIDALNGVDTSVISVRDAVNAMNAAVAGAINALAASYASGGLNPPGAGTGYTGSGGGAGYNDINGIFKDVLGRDASASDAAYWAGLAAGKTAEQLAAAIKADAQANGELPKFAKGGFHSGGIRLVGENGPEIEATGPARYWSASKSAAALNGTASSENSGEMVERQAWTNRLLNQLIQAVNTQTKLGMPVYPVTQ